MAHTNKLNRLLEAAENVLEAFHERYGWDTAPAHEIEVMSKLHDAVMEFNKEEGRSRR